MNRNALNTILLLTLTVLAGYLVGESLRERSGHENPDAEAYVIPDWRSLLSTGSLLHNGGDEVIIVEFSDFQCPFCASAQATLREFVARYEDRVTIVYRHLPLPRHPYAVEAAEASECAHEQGKFGAYHDRLFASPDEIGIKPWEAFAAEAGVDNVDMFVACLQERRYEQRVKDDRAVAAKYGFTGTPTFVVNGEVLVGTRPLSDFEAHLR